MAGFDWRDPSGGLIAHGESNSAGGFDLRGPTGDPLGSLRPSGANSTDFSLGGWGPVVAVPVVLLIIYLTGGIAGRIAGALFVFLFTGIPVYLALSVLLLSAPLSLGVLTGVVVGLATSRGPIFADALLNTVPDWSERVNWTMAFGSGIVVLTLTALARIKVPRHVRRAVPLLGLGIMAVAAAGFTRPAPGTTPQIEVPARGLSAYPTPTSSAASAVSAWVVIANTDHLGAYIRRTPHAEDKVIAWPDGTRLRVIGKDVQSDGKLWKSVEDQLGNRGWIPSEYVVSSSTL